MKFINMMRLHGTLVMMGVVSALVLAGSAGCGDDGDSSGASTDGTGTGSTGGTSETGTTGGGESSGDEPTTSPTEVPGETSSSTGDDTTTGTSGTTGDGVYHLAGTLAYERVPYDHANEGLDYGATETRPMRGVSVRLLDAETDEELASAVSGEDGSYAFDYEGTARVKLWLFAETVSPPITVEDNTSQDQIYVMESAEIDSAADAKLDVVATSGWSGDGYGGPRLAAPFAVLDAAYTATGRFLAETTPAPEFVPLLLNWSVDNRPEDGDPALGMIVTSHWDGTELYILGKADIDTDEFDSHIIIHEWCHAFQTTYTRADTIGGTHSVGDIVDPRVAFSEGSCNAMSGIIFDPDTVYTDSAGPLQGDGFSLNFEDNNIGLESNPGWFSEDNVASIVLDLYDGANEPYDAVEVGLQGVYTAMLTQRDAESFSTLFSFISPLKSEFPGAAADIDALVVYHAADADFGIDAIADEWATGESHTAGLAGNLPLYPVVAIGGMASADMFGGFFNRLGQNRYFRIVGDGDPVTVESACMEDIDLSVFLAGELLETAATPGGYETLTFDTIAGKTYVLTVQGVSEVEAPYSAAISVDH